jgi:hypothetical protein
MQVEYYQMVVVHLKQAINLNKGVNPNSNVVPNCSRLSRGTPLEDLEQ